MKWRLRSILGMLKKKGRAMGEGSGWRREMGENSKEWEGRTKSDTHYAGSACGIGLHGKTFPQFLLCFGCRGLSWEATGNFISPPPNPLPPVVSTGVEEGKDSVKFVPLYTTAAFLQRDFLLTSNFLLLSITMGFN